MAKKTYYIEVEEQGNSIMLFKIKASSEESAINKAVKAMALNYDFGEVDEDYVKDQIDNNGAILMDEDLEETSVEEDE